MALPEITSLASVVWSTSNEGWFITANSDYAVSPRMYFYAALVAHPLKFSSKDEPESRRE
jgi:hypothetical protein